MNIDFSPTEVGFEMTREKILTKNPLPAESHSASLRSKFSSVFHPAMDVIFNVTLRLRLG